MKNNILLSDSLSFSLLKMGLQEDVFSLYDFHKPITKSVKRYRSEHKALLLSLLFNKTYLDLSLLQQRINSSSLLCENGEIQLKAEYGNHIELVNINSIEKEKKHERALMQDIKTVPDFFKKHHRPEILMKHLDSYMTQFRNHHDIELGYMYAILNTEIWHSWSNFKGKKVLEFTKQLFWDVMDFFIACPDKINFIDKIGKRIFTLEDSTIRKIYSEQLFWLKNYYYKIKNEDLIRRLIFTIYQIIQIGKPIIYEHLTLDKIGAAKATTVLLSNDNLYWERGKIYTTRSPYFRYGSKGLCYTSSTYKSVKLFLDEIEYLPVIDSIKQLTKIKNSNDFKTFRENIKRWVEAIQCGDEKLIIELKKNISSSKKSLIKSEKCQKISKIMTYFSLPATAIDMLIGIPAFSLGATITGISAQGYSDMLNVKTNWMKVGY